MPTTTVPPWETPEWKAHCAKERNALAGFRCYLNGERARRGEPEIDTYGSDEEMWRKIHDPVGHQRMLTTRLCIAQGLTDLLETDHVERTVAKFARKYNGPCQCLRAGPDECVSRHAHACSCHLGDPGKCKATSHACCCRHVESYERGNCKATTHACLCLQLESYERSECKACN